MVDSAVALATGLDIVRVNARSWRGRVPAFVSLFAAIVVDVFEVECVQVSGNVSEERQADVDKQI